MDINNAKVKWYCETDETIPPGWKSNQQKNLVNEKYTTARNAEILLHNGENDEYDDTVPEGWKKPRNFNLGKLILQHN